MKIKGDVMYLVDADYVFRLSSSCTVNASCQHAW